MNYVHKFIHPESVCFAVDADGKGHEFEAESICVSRKFKEFVSGALTRLDDSFVYHEVEHGYQGNWEDSFQLRPKEIVWRLSVNPAIELCNSHCQSYEFAIKEELLAASNTLAGMLIYLSNIGAMEDFSNAFIYENLVDGEWEEVELDDYC